MANNAQELKCMILTLKKENVLVPSAVVAEIISVEEIDEVADTPSWMVGKCKWRGEYIPLLSYEAAGGDDVLSGNRSTQVAVLYSLNEESDLEKPNVGLVITGVPHVTRFTADQIKADENASSEHSMIAQRVKVNGVSMSILDIDAMETMVVESNY